jgi:hypothetical protein
MTFVPNAVILNPTLDLAMLCNRRARQRSGLIKRLSHMEKDHPDQARLQAQADHLAKLNEEQRGRSVRKGSGTLW